MDRPRMFKIILVIIILLFGCLYLSQATGYYNYEQYRKKTLTEEAIKEFEKDIKEGKKVDINDYTHQDQNYNNGVSNAGRSMSKGIEKYTKKILGGTFNLLNKLINES